MTPQEKLLVHMEDIELRINRALAAHVIPDDPSFNDGLTAITQMRIKIERLNTERRVHTGEGS